jgi:LPS O-antigen subunit length determinant protein (WzzB/FepE family)
MKKNYSYLSDDEIDLSVLIKALWKEKILILSISIICVLLVQLYLSFKPHEFKTEVTVKISHIQLLEPYSLAFKKSNTEITITQQFIDDFKLDFLSPNNLENFLEQSRGFDNFKDYLKSRNITSQQYFTSDKFGEIKSKNIIIPKKYFLVFPKELDGVIFFNNYAEFVKENFIVKLKKNLTLQIKNHINIYEEALELAKIIQLENPIVYSPLIPDLKGVLNSEHLSYNGIKILSYQIVYLKKLIIKLENDQFNYTIMLDKASYPVNVSKPLFIYYYLGAVIFGLLLAFIIIFFKNILKKK